MRQPERGMILYVKKDRMFGFISPEQARNGDDNLFFNIDALMNCKPEDVRRGTMCSYIRQERLDGRPFAIRVIVDDEYIIGKKGETDEHSSTDSGCQSD